MNNDIKKLMYIVMIDIEMLLKNEVYKSSKDILGKLKNEAMFSLVSNTYLFDSKALV